MNRHNPDFKPQHAPVRKRIKPAVSLWEGWRFENELIYSPSGEFYSKRDIELAWHASQIVDKTYGKQSNILMLKEELRLRNSLTQVPTVSLIFENDDGPDQVYYFDLLPSRKDR